MDFVVRFILAGVLFFGVTAFFDSSINYVLDLGAPWLVTFLSAFILVFVWLITLAGVFSSLFVERDK